MTLDLAPRHKHGLALNGPFLNASGVLGFADEYRGILDFKQLGAFVTNALTCLPRAPARGPNALPTPDGLLLHTGLPNPGVKAALKKWDKDWRRLGPPVIVHLAATTVNDVRQSLEWLERAQGVAGVELGLRDDVSVTEAWRLIHAACGGWPLLARLPILRAAELGSIAADAGADALTLGAPPRHTTAEGHHGRLYSPSTFAHTLAALTAVHAQLNAALPLIASGGIYTRAQAHTLFNAGAMAIQLDAVLWQRPMRLREVASA